MEDFSQHSTSTLIPIPGQRVRHDPGAFRYVAPSSSFRSIPLRGRARWPPKEKDFFSSGSMVTIGHVRQRLEAAHALSVRQRRQRRVVPPPTNREREMPRHQG